MAGKGGCEAVFEDKVNRSLEAGDNVIWESTGKKYPADKIEQAAHTRNDYDVVVGINTVEFCDLKQRNSGRASGAIMAFMKEPENPKVPAPRLPDLTELGPAVSKIISAMTGVVDCVGEPTSQKCPERIDELYVFDNAHWGFKPSIKIKTPELSNPEALQAFSELKAQAKSMLKFMEPHSCSPPYVVV